MPMGTLHYQGANGAAIYVDGYLAGTVPFTTELYGGTYTFRVEYGDGNALEFVKTFDHNLPNSPYTLTIPEAPAPGLHTADSEPLIDEGMVNLFGVTGSMVEIDGQRVGLIPSSVLLSAGEHTFQVTLPNGTEFVRTEVVRFTGDRPTAIPLTPP